MCGIAGMFMKDGRRADAEVLRRMCDSIRHRGPDDDGSYVRENVGLGMRRLSIIDLNSGRQPIHNEDRSVWVVYNGEIYNYLALRKELEKEHRFYTQTDTEVIVHLYEKYGERFVEQLNGMFAFALWDERSRTLLIARDRVGIKPLYYYEDAGRFLFSSEIRSLFENPGLAREVDREALVLYFSFSYAPAPHTMFSKIGKLLPGHFIRIDGNGMSVKRYWDLEFKPRKHVPFAALREEFLSLFRDAVERQMISDVPLGAFLSGGVDSSAIVAMMHEIRRSPVETFSIGYGDRERYFDERADAKSVADRFGTRHHSFRLQPDILEILGKVVESLEEPIADASAIPNYYLSQRTREHVKVALSGLGGDELCGGYPRYVGMALSRVYRLIPGFLRERFIRTVIDSIPDSRNGNRNIDRIKRFIRYGSLATNEAYMNMITTFDGDRKRCLLDRSLMDGREGAAESIFNGYFSRPPGSCSLNRLLYTDCKLYLVEDLLSITDKMSMAHSLEVRVPFLDNEIVDFMASLPEEWKIHGFSQKYILKKSMEGRLSKSTLYKEKKGFSVPLAIWFREDLKRFLEAYLTEEKIRRTGFLNWEPVRRIMDDHFGRKCNYYNQIWTILIFCLWHDIHIANEADYRDLVTRSRKAADPIPAGPVPGNPR